MPINLKEVSEWRKWDLHIHTPNTKLNNGYGDRWDDFVEKINESDIDVFGITDYFSIDNYKCFLEKFQIKYPDSKKIFFPNIEFRIDSKNKKAEHIQFHVIFSNQSETINKIDEFLTRLPLLSTDDQNLKKYCTESDLREVGFDKAMVTIGNLKKKLSGDFSKGEYMVVCVVNGYGGLRPDSPNDGRGGEYAKELDKVSDLFFGTKDNVDFYLNKVKGRKELPQKAVLVCSDCHSFKDMQEKLGGKFTWIKADPTFTGLMQILCEPGDRVKIQSNKPEGKTGYHVIKSIKIDDEICKQTISLNPNLNTIIGGRSTGKSILLRSIACGIDPDIASAIRSKTLILFKGIKIIWQDGEENKDRDIEFFSQNYMHKIAHDQEKKNGLIKGIVKEGGSGAPVGGYEKFCDNNKNVLQANIDSLFSLQNDLSELTANLKEEGDESGLKKEIEVLESKIKESRPKDSFSENELIKFEELKEEILELARRQQKLAEDKNEIVRLKDEDFFDASFNYKLNQLSELNSKAIQEIFDSVKQQAIKEWQDKLSIELTKIDGLLEQCKNAAQEKIESSIFTKGENYLRNNKQYKELKDRLDTENKKLAEIISLQNQINKVNGQKKALFTETIQNHISYTAKIDELIRNFSLAHDDIEIKIEKTYLHDKCKGLLEDFINLQSHERQNFVNGWGSAYKTDTKTEIENFLQQALENKIELKSRKDIKDLTKGLLTENWFSISYELTYQKDTFDKMSDGKKAFVILKLLLEFSNKKCPILIDQPEDSLDNRAIYSELVTYLKQKKKKRQIILVTHNANIVVNADAEEVIVANQHGENSKNQNNVKFQYISGSIENTILKNPENDIVLQSQGIREHVCEILEGGTEAFKKRENKYAIN